MGFFSFVSKTWDGLKSLPSKAWDTVKNGASDTWLTVKHAAGSVTDLVKSGAKAIGKAVLIVYHKAEDITKTLYNDAKDLVHQPFQVLSNPLTMAMVAIGGIAVICGLTKFSRLCNYYFFLILLFCIIYSYQIRKQWQPVLQKRQ